VGALFALAHLGDASGNPNSLPRIVAYLEEIIAGKVTLLPSPYDLDVEAGDREDLLVDRYEVDRVNQTYARVILGALRRLDE
jgi:hypothetical protein